MAADPSQIALTNDASALSKWLTDKLLQERLHLEARHHALLKEFDAQVKRLQACAPQSIATQNDADTPIKEDNMDGIIAYAQGSTQEAITEKKDSSPRSVVNHEPRSTFEPNTSLALETEAKPTSLAKEMDSINAASSKGVLSKRPRGAFSARAQSALANTQAFLGLDTWEPLPETVSRSVNAKEASPEPIEGRDVSSSSSFAQMVFGEALGLPDNAKLGITDNKTDGPNQQYIVGVDYVSLRVIILRKEEDLESPQLAQYPEGTKVRVLQRGTGATGKRLKIRIANTEVVGWISVTSKEGRQLLRRADPDDAISMDLLTKLASE